MRGNNLERWQELCAQAAVEQDPKKLRALVVEIGKLLTEKQERLDNEAKDKNAASG
jgi:hypothetical protein